jgi:hypothetical protein
MLLSQTQSHRVLLLSALAILNREARILNRFSSLQFMCVKRTFHFLMQLHCLSLRHHDVGFEAVGVCVQSLTRHT